MTLTPNEHLAIAQAAELWATLRKVVGDGPTRNADLNELIVHIHAIQLTVMSQSAYRAHPELYRRLGE